MTTWVDLQDALLADIPGCSYATGAAALRNAAREFCRKSLAWRETLAPMELAADIQMHGFALSTELEFIKLTGAKLDGREIDALLPHQVGHGNSGVAVLNTEKFRVYPAPSDGQSIELTVAVSPSMTATGIPNWIASTYSDAIMYGARARLFGAPNQPYSDRIVAELAEAKFKEEIGRAITATAKAYSNAPLRVRPHYF